MLGIVEKYWALFGKVGALSENSSPPLVSQAGYRPEAQRALVSWQKLD